MDQDDKNEAGPAPDVALVQAASIGFLLYSSVLQLILANPPANDMDRRAPTP